MAPPVEAVTVPGSAAVETHGLTKHFGQQRAVDGLSFAIPRGVIAGLVGPNGAGKTTTLRMLLGLVRPSGGNASVLGHSIRHPRVFMHDVGALIEGPAFYPTLSGRTNLSTLATLGRHRNADIDGLLRTVGLADRGRHNGDVYLAERPGDGRGHLFGRREQPRRLGGERRSRSDGARGCHRPYLPIPA